MIFRSERDKADLQRSWQRSDRSFFASGACHVLAHVFLTRHPESGYRALQILPKPGFRGGHVVVSDGQTVFDYHGYSAHGRFMAHYFHKVRRYFPDWQADLIPVGHSLIGRTFCEKFQARMPDQYWHDPIPRAQAFLNQFKAPNKSEPNRFVWPNPIPNAQDKE